jgi:hypothetical protein
MEPLGQQLARLCHSLLDHLLVKLKPLRGIGLHSMPIALLEARSGSLRNDPELVLKCVAGGVNDVGA